MSIKEEEVKHIAQLARLGLSEADLKRYSSELSDVFSYFKMLDELDVEGVEPTSQVTGLTNVYFADEIERDFCKREKLLSSTPLEVEKDQIKVMKVLE